MKKTVNPKSDASQQQDAASKQVNEIFFIDQCKEAFLGWCQRLPEEEGQNKG
jgi:hypothetical protein